MKKALLVIIAIIVTTVFVSVPVCAGSTEVLKGTPTVDGVLDDIYKQSVSVLTQGPGFYADPAGNESNTDAEGTTYILYDDAYLYFCAVIEESTIMSAGASYVNGVNPWMNDNAEFWYTIKGGSKLKVAADAFGTRVFTDPALLGKTDDSTIDYSIYKFGVTKTADSYTVEIAVPISGAVAGDKIGLALQIDDLIEQGKIVAIGSQEPVEYTLSSDSVTGGSSATPTPTATTAKPTATKTAAPDNDNPETGDPLTLIYAFAGLSGVFGYAIIRKNKFRK